MTAIPLPITSAPGAHPHEGGGRLINCYAEKLSDTAGTKTVRHRVPGLTGFATSAQVGFRGMKVVGSNLYSAWSGKVYKCTSSGGALAALTGALTGTAQVFMARNNAATPDLVIVAPGDGAFVASTTAVSSYPDGDVGAPNAVCVHKGFFIFTYGTGAVSSSGVNVTAVATTDFATAEYKPDTLYRPLSYKGQLILWGSESAEFWSGVNTTGFPFSFVSAMDIGIVGPYAVAGDEDGFDSGIFFVGSDFRFRKLNGYTSDVIPNPDLERLIAAVEVKTTITVSVYVSNGRPVVVVQCPAWTWEYSVSSEQWNERVSYNELRWRGVNSHLAFGQWLCGDTESGNIIKIDATQHEEIGNPLRMRIETGPMGDFPKPLRVDRVELYVTKGVGIATGSDPDQTDPAVEISMSPDGGLSWKVPRVVKLGRQSVMTKQVATNNLGHAISQGVRLRFDISDAVPVGVMGGDMISSALR